MLGVNRKFRYRVYLLQRNRLLGASHDADSHCRNSSCVLMLLNARSSAKSTSATLSDANQFPILRPPACRNAVRWGNTATLIRQKTGWTWRLVPCPVTATATFAPCVNKASCRRCTRSVGTKGESQGAVTRYGVLQSSARFASPLTALQSHLLRRERPVCQMLHNLPGFDWH
jgi:hypothetical protein